MVPINSPKVDSESGGFELQIFSVDSTLLFRSYPPIPPSLFPPSSVDLATGGHGVKLTCLLCCPLLHHAIWSNYGRGFVEVGDFRRHARFELKIQIEILSPRSLISKRTEYSDSLTVLLTGAEVGTTLALRCELLKRRPNLFQVISLEGSSRNSITVPNFNSGDPPSGKQRIPDKKRKADDA